MIIKKEFEILKFKGGIIVMHNLNIQLKFKSETSFSFRLNQIIS